MPHLKSRMKSIIFCLTFVSCFSTVHASTFGFEDQIKSIEYGAKFNASVKIVDLTPFTLDDFVGFIEHPHSTVERCHKVGMKFTQEQLIHMKECILESGGAEEFLLKNQDKLNLETTSEFTTIIVEDGIFKPQYNLSTIQFAQPRTGSASTGTIIDVQSIGLPLDLQRRVFLTCTHHFRNKAINEEIQLSQLEQYVVDVACETSPNMIHRPDFKRYKIESLFYVLDQDIAFGILDKPVDEHVTPLSLIMNPLKLKEAKIITFAGYGRGSIWSDSDISEYTITDDIKRAGHQMIKGMVNYTNGEEITCYPFEKQLDISIISEEIIPPGSISLRDDDGHSGSGGLIWNMLEEKFEVVGILRGGDWVNCPRTTKEHGIDLDAEEYGSFEIYCKALEEKILPKHEGELIEIYNMSEDTNEVMEITDGKIGLISFPEIQYINPHNYATFFDYSKELKETFFGMKKRTQALNCAAHFIPASPYVSRFFEKFKELDYLKTNAKGIYKI